MSDNLAAKSGALSVSSRTERNIANDDRLLTETATSDDSSDHLADLVCQLECGNFAPIVSELQKQSFSQTALDNGLILSNYHKRLLLEGGHFNLVAALSSRETTKEVSQDKSVPTSDPLLILALFHTGRIKISRRMQRSLQAKSFKDADQIIALAQLIATGCALYELPRATIHSAVELLSGLAIKLELAQDLSKASQVYLRLATTMSVALTHGTTISRSIYKHVQQIAPDEGTRLIAYVTDVVAAASLGLAGKHELLKELQEILAGGHSSLGHKRWSLALKVSQALLKVSECPVTEIEHIEAGALESGDLTTAFGAKLILIDHWLARGQLSQARQIAIRAEQLGENMGFASGVLSCQISSLHITVNQGEHDSSCAKIKQLFKNVLSTPGGVSYALPLAAYCARVAMFDECDSLLDFCLRRFRSVGANNLQIPALQAKAQAHLQRDQIDRAISLCTNVERRQRAMGNEYEALETRVLSLQIRFSSPAAHSKEPSSCADVSRFLKKTKSLLQHIPTTQSEYLSAKIAQIEGHRYFFTGEYIAAQNEFNRAKSGYQTLGMVIDLGFVSGLLGLVQLESARKGVHNKLSLLRLALDNVVQSAEIMQQARIRSEEARMWQTAAIICVEMDRESKTTRAETAHENTQEQSWYQNLILCESYFDRCWQCLDELSSLSVMDQSASNNQNRLSQIVNAALGISETISILSGGEVTLLEKWQHRAKSQTRYEYLA
jgi:hypothetical protein